MAYSAEVLRRARQSLAQMKTDAESEYNQRVYEAYAQVPRLKQIDMELRRSMTLAAQTVFTQGGDARAAMEDVKKANLALQQERAQLVAERFAPGWLDEKPVCAHCGGSGYMGSAMCSCLKELCLQEQKKELQQLTGGQERFDTFRLDYYPEQVNVNYGASPRTIMERNLKSCRQYAQAFREGIGNLLLVGGTGLGKTFLSACIANAVTDKGFSVTYESAPQLFSKLEKNRFNPDDESRRQIEQITDCDLLIIDDLGTELPGNFVTAALYSLLNDRLLSGKSMLVSTNLNIDEMAKRYSPQIASRFEGNFKCLPFVGNDIRVMKNRGL